MVNQMVATIMEQIKTHYPGVEIPAAMRAVITSAIPSGSKYSIECKIYCRETGEKYHCEVETEGYRYTVRILDNNGTVLEQYPELIDIESRQQLRAGDLVQVVFLGNELEAAIVGG